MPTMAMAAAASIATEKTTDGPEEPARLLDPSIESGFCALGITDQCISTDVVVEDSASGGTDARGCQFDFIHIRYRAPGLAQRVFRIAFEQTKPGGWIEVVVGTPPPPSSPPSIKRQLISAGFVDVEEKPGARISGWQRLGMLVRAVLKVGMFGLSAEDGACGKKGDAAMGMSVFVIARKPW